jgi:hypothetical protein
MSLIAQLLLESSTCAYLESLVKEVKWLLIKLDFKDALLVMLFIKQKKPTKSYCLSYPWESENIFPSLLSLTSTLCTHDLFTLVACAPWEASSCMKDSSGGHMTYSCIAPLDVYFFPLFNYRTLNTSIVRNIF